MLTIARDGESDPVLFDMSTDCKHLIISHAVEKVGAILKKVSIEAIPMLYYLGKVSIKGLYCFKSQKL